MAGPDSRTTLLERVLGKHSQITPAGELSDFTLQWHWAADQHDQKGADGSRTTVDFAELGQRYLDQTQWRAAGKPFYVDKLPQNYLLAGFIRRGLPQGRIVHVSRGPMDLCFPTTARCSAMNTTTATNFQRRARITSSTGG